ncbi:hypothetical protein LUX12_10105 [Streptomyces somaliensis]|uniref:hypothetical protein n=1 Tax=Streptomyces somaliensis TaxID=78355 RepID=UPI0020CFB071|nr:hypothetical protein [Streptomyces somaliensis]MCP9945054.1 hypothetical protein [Streptomyces somaliensis]MCP9961730.1 hypothetical protein [Streptomyces somaliensis]MCP9974545.1 hypothetical protein [Streptomyces somaliensis]
MDGPTAGAVPPPPGVCTGGTHTVTPRHGGGKLHYTSDDAAAGRPHATLDRAE